MSVEDSKRCSRCGEVKALAFFSKRRDSAGYYGRCKVCKAQIEREYYRKRNPDKREHDWTVRFWGFVEDVGDCWEWKGFISRDGYGYFTSAKKVGASTTQIAHRLAYELVVGVIPSGLQLDHLCRNRACVNPAHLEPVTNAENHQRGWRASRTHCPHGHPFSGDNLYVHPSGQRVCKACSLAAKHRYRAKLKAAVEVDDRA